MKLLEELLLIEREIRLPTKGVKRAYDFVLTVVLKAAIEGDPKNWKLTGRREAQEAVKRCVNDMLTGTLAKVDADVNKVASFKAETTVDLSDVPPRYLKSLSADDKANAKEELKKVKLVVSFAKGRVPGAYDPNTNTVTIRLGTCDLNPEEWKTVPTQAGLKERFERAFGVVDHEVTHAVQELVLGQAHPAQNDNAGPYMSQQVEQDPMVKSSVVALRHLLTLKKGDPKEIFKKFVADGDYDSFGKGVSEFFFKLRERDKVKWKKAVKLITQLYRAKYGDEL